MLSKFLRFLPVAFVTLVPHYLPAQEEFFFNAPFGLTHGAPFQRIVLKIRPGIFPELLQPWQFKANPDLPGDALKQLAELLAALRSQGWTIRWLYPESSSIGECPISLREANGPILEAIPPSRSTPLEAFFALLPRDLDPLQKVLGAAYPEPFLEVSADSIPEPLENGQGYFKAIKLDKKALPASKDLWIVNVECDVDDSHEDMPPALAISGTRSGRVAHRNHGAAVLGILGAPKNNKGILGMVPGATLGFEGVVCKNGQADPAYEQNLETALVNAARRVRRGGLVVVPLQLVDVQLDINCPNPECKILPPELSPTVRDAIKAITTCGVTVVEAAGNGNCPLDNVLREVSAHCEPVFNRKRFDSEAILVGAGDDDDNARRPSSNYGDNRVDLHAWGENVVTLGTGDVIGPTGRYTRYFSGTSSATAIVAGVAARVANARIEANKKPLTPLCLRKTLIDTATTSAAKEIGPLPNAKKAIKEAPKKEPDCATKPPAA